MPVQRPYNPDARRIAELMQADLAKVGVKAKIVSYEWGEYRKRVQAGEHADGRSSAGPATTATPTISSSRWRAVPRPVRAAATRRNGATSSSTTLIKKAATISDQAERAKLYKQAQVIMHEEAPFYLIAHSVVFMPMRKEVVGYKMSPFGRHQFDAVDLK